MNKHDRDNLNFIMSLNDEQFEEWASSVPDDDIQYALEIIQAARLEKLVHEHEILDQISESNLSEAKSLLQKFRL